MRSSADESSVEKSAEGTETLVWGWVVGALVSDGVLNSIFEYTVLLESLSC